MLMYTLMSTFKIEPLKVEWQNYERENIFLKSKHLITKKGHKWFATICCSTKAYSKGYSF